MPGLWRLLFRPAPEPCLLLLLSRYHSPSCLLPSLRMCSAFSIYGALSPVVPFSSKHFLFGRRQARSLFKERPPEDCPFPSVVAMTGEGPGISPASLRSGPHRSDQPYRSLLSRQEPPQNNTPPPTPGRLTEAWALTFFLLNLPDTGVN